MTKPVVSNADFWKSPGVVSTQQARPFLHWYERYLMDAAIALLRPRFGSAEHIHVVGCGPGRELPMVRQAFPHARIVASDISPAMVDACRANLAEWGAEANVELFVGAIGDLSTSHGIGQLVVALNNVLTYVTPRAERRRAFGAMRSLLEDGGVLLGAVHHQWGRPTKSAYFLAQRLAAAVGLRSDEVGDRVGGFSGLRTNLHYFTRREVHDLLVDARFTPLEVQSLATLARKLGTRHPAYCSYNNLIFLAQAV
jgi:SAM-dependent methyltransferase